MVRQARLCVVESAEEAYGMGAAEFRFLESLQPLDICDHCGEPCETRSETLISLCAECREESHAEEDAAIAEYQDRYGSDYI